MTKPGLGHNGGPAIADIRTVWAWTDEFGERHLSTTHPDDRRCRPLPGRDSNGLMRPARDYAAERWMAGQRRAH